MTVADLESRLAAVEEEPVAGIEAVSCSAWTIELAFSGRDSNLA